MFGLSGVQCIGYSKQVIENLANYYLSITNGSIDSLGVSIVSMNVDVMINQAYFASLTITSYYKRAFTQFDKL